ncbi:MAG: DUF11 domain-containing protein, partial [Calditrichaeota bacterium]
MISLRIKKMLPTGVIVRMIITAMLILTSALPLAAADNVPAFQLGNVTDFPASNSHGVSIPPNYIFDVTFGWSFTVGAAEITVSALGIYDSGEDGLFTAHEVGIWTSAGVLVASAPIPSGTSATLISGCRYVDITPVILQAGQTYVIGAYYPPVYQTDPHEGDQIIASQTFANEIFFSAPITWGDARQSDLFDYGVSPLTFPNLVNETDGRIGPNFLCDYVELSINGLTQSEGNSSTTAFDFTVSLTNPAPSGGVSFDIATADGVDSPATAPSDYIAKSLTGVSVSAGQSSYTFSVLVNGDTDPEADETFLVNVTNVSGAYLADGQAIGRIINDDVATPALSGTLSDELLIDNNNDGQANPGDRIQYTAVITNTGTAAANTVTYSDTLDSNVTPVIGSGTTTQGTINDNYPGPAVYATIGTMAPASEVTITFAVDIKSPLSNDTATEICQKGAIVGSNFDPKGTDDPDVGGASDQTCTPIVQLDIIYVSSAFSGIAGGVSFTEADILSFDPNNETWSMHFDASASGITNPAGVSLNALLVQDDGSFLMSFNQGTLIPGVGTVSDEDIVQFTPNTGVFDLRFDGSDLGLSGTSLDAIDRLPNGNLIISTTSAFSASGVSGNAEDLIEFTSTSLGPNTSGTFSLYFDGSDVGLSGENIDGIWIESGSGNIYLSPSDVFVAGSTCGNEADIFSFTPTSLGVNTAGTFSLFWDGSENDFAGQNVNGLSLSGANIGAAPFQVPCLPNLIITQTDALLIDNNNDGQANPGDRIQYTVIINNTGTVDATGVVYSDSLDNNTLAVIGSGTTTQGTITENNSGVPSIFATIGSMAPGSADTLTFAVDIKSPLANAAAIDICNQGTVWAGNFSPIASDDPDVGGASDPTCTPLSLCGTPTLTSETADYNVSTVTLVIDANDPGGIDSLNFSLLNNLTVLDADDFTSGNGTHWTAPLPNPAQATFVLQRVDAGLADASYDATISLACGGSADIGNSFQFTVGCEPLASILDLAITEINDALLAGGLPYFAQLELNAAIADIQQAQALLNSNQTMNSITALESAWQHAINAVHFGADLTDLLNALIDPTHDLAVCKLAEAQEFAGTYEIDQALAYSQSHLSAGDVDRNNDYLDEAIKQYLISYYASEYAIGLANGGNVAIANNSALAKTNSTTATAQISELQVIPAENGAELSWVTGLEVDVKGFLIFRTERSFADVFANAEAYPAPEEFKQLGEMIAGSGTSQHLNEYSFTDTRLSKNTFYYYMILEVFTDGSTGNPGAYNNGPVSVSMPAESGRRVHVFNITATSIASGVEVNWEVDNAEKTGGYHVYRAEHIDGQYVRLNNDLLTGLSFIDAIVAVGQTYYYKVADVNEFGLQTWHNAVSVEVNAVTAVEEEAPLPTAFSLEQNYPNPFNPRANITFTLPQSSDVTLSIYNPAGQLVRTLTSGQ